MATSRAVPPAPNPSAQVPVPDRPNTPDSRAIESALSELAALWRKERLSSREAFAAERAQRPLAERVQRGVALSGLGIVDTDASPGGRILLWVAPDATHSDLRLNELRIHQGAPVQLWAGEGVDRQVEQGVVARVLRDKLAVAVSADYADFLDQQRFALDLIAPEVTFNRGDQGLQGFLNARADSSQRTLAAVFFSQQAPRFDPPAPWEPKDSALNGDQRAAVDLCLRARNTAAVHGPPGTGKTRTLCEVVVQRVKRGERVWVAAGSHAAVDNLAERVAEAGIALVRLGHPARVSPTLEGRTLDALLDGSDARKLSRRWIADANDIRRKVERRRARGQLDRRQARQMLAASRQLMRDARAALDSERKLIMARAPVICSTVAGADSSVLHNEAFDALVLDEAAQVPAPLALYGAQHAPVVILGGDDRQLPPTVIDVEAARAGLSVTLFERFLSAHGARAVHLLTEQYRMHEDIMRYPSVSMYDGKLRAAPAVAHHRLEQLPGVAPDPQRERPWLFIDTAGKGWEEERSDDDPSTRNPGQAERVVAEAQRLLQRGLPARDLAVIAPYQAQVTLLRDLLREEVDAGLEIDSVDGFQGREKEAVIVDLVRSNDSGEIGFLADTRRTHVAITRARRLLLIIADSATLQSNRYYQQLIEEAETQGSWLSAWADDAPPFEG